MAVILTSGLRYGMDTDAGWLLSVAALPVCSVRLPCLTVAANVRWALIDRLDKWTYFVP